MIYFSLNSNGYMRDSNSLLSTSLGYSAVELANKNIQELLSPTSLQKRAC